MHDEMPSITAAQASAAQAAIKGAADDVASAITRLVNLGSDAPQTAREALSMLGSCFVMLGMCDPNVPYSAHGPEEEESPYG